MAGVEKVLCKCGGKGQKGSVWRLGGWILQTGIACFCAFCLQQVVVRSRLNSIGRTVVQLAHLPRANSSLLRRGARPHTEPLLFSASVIAFNLLDSCTIRFEFLLCNALIKVSKKSSTQNHYRRSRWLTRCPLWSNYAQSRSHLWNVSSWIISGVAWELLKVNTNNRLFELMCIYVDKPCWVTGCWLVKTCRVHLHIPKSLEHL